MKQVLVMAGMMGLALTVTACSEDESATTDAGATTAGDTGSTDGGDVQGGDDTNEPADAGQDTGGTTGSDIIIAPPDTNGGDEDTVQTGPAETCREAVLCRVRCETDECRDACADGASEEIVAQMQAIDTCLEDCQGSVEVQCMLDPAQCYSQFQACFAEGQTGEKNCEETLECYAQCAGDSVQEVFETFAEPPANPTCEDACIQDAGPDAQRDFVTYGFCIVEFCSTNPGAGCQKIGENAACGSQTNQCLNVQ